MKQKPLRNNVFSFVTLSWFSTCRSLPVNHSSYTKCSIFPLPKIESICRKYGFSNKVYFYCLSVIPYLRLSLVFSNFSLIMLFLPNDHQAENEEKKVIFKVNHPFIIIFDDIKSCFITSCDLKNVTKLSRYTR